MNHTSLIAALNRAARDGDAAEARRLQSLCGTVPPQPEYKSAQQEMDELLGEELSLEALRAQFPGCSDYALEDWQLHHRAWLYKSIKGLEAGPMPPSSPPLDSDFSDFTDWRPLAEFISSNAFTELSPEAQWAATERWLELRGPIPPSSPEWGR